MNLDTFDFVIQLSRDKLLAYMLENLVIGGFPAVPQFVLKANSQQGSISAILDDVQIALQPGANQGTLTYRVYAATIALANQPQLGFSDGQIAIAFTLTPGRPFKILLKSASFTTSQTTDISDTKTFFAAVSAIVGTLIDTTNELDLFPNTPDTSALILIGLMLNGKVFCLDADTVCAVIGQGDTSKVDNLLNKNDFGIGLSAAWVKANLLFPSEAQLLNPQDVANLIGITTGQAAANIATPTVVFLNSVKSLLPPPFGSGEAKQTSQGVDTFFNFMDFTLMNGSIAMHATFHGEAFCAHIHNGVVDEAISLSIVNQQVVTTFVPNPPKPTYSVEFDFWCALGFLFLASNLALVTGIVATAIAIAIVTSLDIQQKNLGANPASIPGFDQITWTGLQIFTFGLVLRGKSTAAVGYLSLEKRVDISVTTSPFNVVDAGAGTYHFNGNLVCKPQDFQYEEFRQDLVTGLVPVTQGLLFPVKTTWRVHGQTIGATSGQITYVDTVHTAVPPFDGTTLTNHQIAVDYVLNPGFVIYKKYNGLDSLRLTVAQADYNFGLFVEIAVTDASGHTYTSQVLLDVQTDVAKFGQDYDDFVKQCALAGKVKLSTLKTVPQRVLTGGDPLTPVEMTNLVSEVVAENPGASLGVVRALAQTNGGAVLKAFAPKVGLQVR